MNQTGAARNWIIAYIAFAAVGLGVLIGVGKIVGANKLPGEPQAEQTSTDGETLFLANCAACHGINGTGGRGPSLVSGPLGSISEAELRARIANGRRLGGMPKFEGFLTQEQIGIVAAYVIGLRVAS